MVKVLSLVEFYLPGYTAGGPIRTISNLVDQLGDRVEFTILTRQADPRDPKPYENVEVDTLVRVGKADVYYASRSRLSLRGMRALLHELVYDVLYLNSLLSPRFTVLPLLLRRLGLIPRRPVVLAPRGELNPGALAMKRAKKRLFLAWAKLFGLYNGILWQATNEREAEYIRAWFGDSVQIRTVPNLPDHHLVPLTQRSCKRKGSLRICSVSRIVRNKNLDGALRHLQALHQGDVTFDIYGPCEDAAYWKECQALIDDMPSNVSVNYKGALFHEQVRDVLANYDLFFLLTHGENYGHAIAEAFSAGCPVLISDQTPWRGLADRKAGWDVPFDAADSIQHILNYCIDMDDKEMEVWRCGAQKLMVERLEDATVIDGNAALFAQAAGGSLEVLDVYM